MPFKVGQKVKFLFRTYSKAEKHDEYTKTRVQGTGRVVEFKDEGEKEFLVVDTGASYFDLPINADKDCYIQPLD
jgi:hypothetical protein